MPLSTRGGDSSLEHWIGHWIPPYSLLPGEVYFIKFYFTFHKIDISGDGGATTPRLTDARDDRDGGDGGDAPDDDDLTVGLNRVDLNGRRGGPS